LRRYGVARAVARLLARARLRPLRARRSFVLAVADQYKAEIAIPAAFDAAAEGDEDVPTRTCRALRERINKSRLLERCTADVKQLVRYEEFAADGSGEDEDWAGLQTDGDRVLDGGRTYGDEPIW
jgi:CRISPR-associated protein Cas1